MKPSKKTNRIYEALRKKILMRQLVPGKLLPKEEIFAVNLGVSRDTLRKALAILEAEHLVRRVKGHGTYVTDAIPKRKITLLLPCPDEICMGSYHLLHYLHGIQDACCKLQCELETLAVSPTNNIDDIDWKNLFNLNKDSLVLVYGYWFMKIFPFLVASRCKVLLTHEQLRYDKYDLKDYLKLPDWNDFLLNREDEAYKMVRHMYESGYRRPAFLMEYLNEDDNIMPVALRAACDKILPGYKPPFYSAERTTNESTIIKNIEKYVIKENCDCVFINLGSYQDVIQRNYPDLPCGFFHRNSIKEFHGNHKWFYSRFDFVKIGYQAVEQLLHGNEATRHRVFQCNIYDYQTEKNRKDGEL